MSSQQSLQDTFLASLKDKNAQVSIFLVNGIKLHGVIESFDNDVILLKSAVTQMIFKQAISTVVPSQAISKPHAAE